MRRLGIALLLAALIACGQTGRTVTIDGQDSTGATVSPINLWNNYQTRSRVVGQVNHGDVVTLLQQSGAGCEVRTAAGTTGWLTCANFIREFKSP